MSASKLQQKYSFIQKIQEGTYGIVFKARSNLTKEIFAVKVFKAFGKVGLPISFIRQRYMHEIIESNYKVQVIEIFAQESQPAIVMEWLDTSIDQAVISNKIIKTKELFRQILKGVLEFHNNGIIHRDLKPSNIMLQIKSLKQIIPSTTINLDQYSIKIIDYGMAKELSFTKISMTNQIGSLFFRAPELLLGSTSYGEQIDIWSLGCIFYFMLTGNILFKTTNQIEQLKKIIWVLGIDTKNINNPSFLTHLNKIKIQDSQSHWQDIKSNLTQVQFHLLQKMLSLDPNQRANIRQLLQHPYFK